MHNTNKEESIVLKKCRRCAEVKNLHDFGSNVSSKDGKSCYCKKCRRDKEQWKKGVNPEKYKEEKKVHYLKYKDGYKDRQLKRHFGIGLNEYNEMFKQQDGKCKCCHSHQKDLKLALAVDHCHVSGKVRGLLCGQCNTALGLAKDDISILNGMIEYLRSNK